MIPKSAYSFFSFGNAGLIPFLHTVYCHCYSFFFWVLAKRAISAICLLCFLFFFWYAYSVFCFLCKGVFRAMLSAICTSETRTECMPKTACRFTGACISYLLCYSFFSVFLCELLVHERITGANICFTVSCKTANGV